jgi:prephenate dehydrogenase
MTITVVGVGLIGGSMALGLKDLGIVEKVIGVGRKTGSLEKAMQLQIIDAAMSLEEAVKEADVIYIAIPVDATVDLVLQVMDLVHENQVVIDAGSTKFALCNAVKDHPMRKQFVATHPMWGTEFSGPEAAVKGAFAGRACVICEKDSSSTKALLMAETLYKAMGMHIIYMNADNHDIHAAYVSHISHITSFALANTVLEKEKEEDAIFEMAGGGFESTVRLAKSSPAMWAPIFMQNKENVLDVLNEHISQLRKFKACIEKENMEYLVELIENANKIKRILK